MNDLTPKERIFRVFEKKPVDRPPVVCPGGMMNAAIVDVMRETGHTLPLGHHDPGVMAALSEDISRHTGFENYGVPFCMTVEAEVLGSGVDFGTLECEPKVKKELYGSVADVKLAEPSVILSGGRIGAISKAVELLAKRGADIPVIGSLTGPISTAASLVDPMTFLKELRKDKDNSHRVLEYVTDFLVAYAYVLIGSGANVIAIGDPTATGEILGPKMFEEYAVRYINRLIDGIRKTNTPVIVHICGKLEAVKHFVPAIRAQAISTDAMVSLKLLKEEFPTITTMGNLSTYMLEFCDPEKVSARTRTLIKDRIDIIAPACGLSTSSALGNIRALTETVKGNA